MYQGWSYNNIPNFRTRLSKNHSQLMAWLKRKDRKHLWSSTLDTRLIHKELFKGLTPSNEPEYAGNYRGSKYDCLKYYDVNFGQESGCPHATVAQKMEEFAHKYLAEFRALEGELNLLKDVGPSLQSLQMIIDVAAPMAAEFLRIHPFADGNGHMARYIITATIYGGCQALPLRFWRIDPRPDEPDPNIFVNGVKSEDAGGTLLREYILSCYLIEEI